MLHADSADISSTDITYRGVSPALETTGSGGSVLRQCGIFLFSALLASGAWSAPPKSTLFDEVPEAAVKELPAKPSALPPIAKGYVFVDGCYVAPPYKVERYGTAIRINGVQVTHQVVGWDEFLATQSGSRTEKVPAAMVKKMVEEEYTEEVKEEVEIDVSDDIDDLFDDEATDSAKKGKTHREKRVITKQVKKTRMVEKLVPGEGPEVDKVVFDGPFRQNGKVRSLVGKIDTVKRKIESELKLGKLLCFGHDYSMISGDPAAGQLLVSKLWELQKDYDRIENFMQASHAAGIGFVSEPVLRGMFEHRLEYLKVQKRALSGR